MLGAIAGDVIGSVYERMPIKSTDFPLFSLDSTFTDDSVMTVAIADAILNRRDYAVAMQTYGRKYPNAGYGGFFYRWLFSSPPKPYNSWGNGSAMRVSPIGFAFSSIDAVLHEAQCSAEVTHNHPEGVKGAQAVAMVIFLARSGETKQSIKDEIGGRFGYNLDRTLDEIRPEYGFDVSCQGSVPESIIGFLESADFEGAIRNVVSLGGDSDTMACIAGGISQAFYKDIPDEITANVRQRLPEEFLNIIDKFDAQFE